MYYLQSRYFDSVTARFINVDEAVFGTCLADSIIANNLFAYANNTPVMNVDSSGYYSTGAYAISASIYRQMVAMAASVVTFMTSIKISMAMIWSIVVVGFLIAAIAAVICISKTLGNVYSTVEKRIKVSEEEYKKYDGEICIYVLARETNKLDSIFYVGRTKNIKDRHAKHSNKNSRYYKGNFCMYVVYTCTSEIQAKVAEQCVLGSCLIGEFTSIMFGTMPSNMIRGIAKKNFKKVIDALKKEKDDTLSLLGCTSENELLYMMEH